MINYVTGYEYTGKNAEILMCLDVEKVLTFKQMIKLKGMSGKKMKGLKKCATLIGYKTVTDEEGKKEKKPFYFGVFDANAVLQRNRIREVKYV